MREHLNEVARRRMAVLDPVKLVIDGYPEGKEERMEVPDHPQKPDWGRRAGSLLEGAVDRKRGLRRFSAQGLLRLFPATRCGCATATW